MNTGLNILPMNGARPTVSGFAAPQCARAPVASLRLLRFKGAVLLTSVATKMVKRSARKEAGYALILTMFMVGITTVILAATLSRLGGDADLNARNGQYNASL